MKELMKDRQSLVIDCMRFPLAMLVVFGHMLPFQFAPINRDVFEINWYHFISEMISHTAAYRTPCFFLLSGYFFFLKIGKEGLMYAGGG